MSDKFNEQDIPDELEEELRIVGEIYADRLKSPGNPLGGEELYKEARKKLDEMIRKGLL